MYVCTFTTMYTILPFCQLSLHSLFSAPLSVDVEPKHQVVDYGRPATFKCNYRGNPVKAVFWLKNGNNIGHTEKTLRINSVKKEDRGMYQCFVVNDQVRLLGHVLFIQTLLQCMNS
jgi:hypothetical protein